MFRNLTLLAAALVLLSAASLCADDAVLGQMYGSGVHAYFSRNYVKAYDYLTSAIDGGTADPRCYYFRGLTYIRLGREPEAEMDFAKGAKLEGRDVDRFYSVARSLGRIQGGTRLVLEEHRGKARLAAMKKAEEARKRRYEATRAEEDRVLHQPIAPAPSLPAPEPDGIFAPDSPPSAEVDDQSTVPPVVPAPGDGVPPVVPAPGDGTSPIEPAPVTNGQKKPGGIFDALRSAVGKAITGDGDGPGKTTEGDDEPSAKPPDEAPHVPPAEPPEDPFADEPSAKPPAETPADTSEEPAVEPIPEPPDDPFAD